MDTENEAGKAGAGQIPVPRDGRVEQVFCVDVDSTAAGINFRQRYLRSSDAILMLQGGRVSDLNPAAMRLFKCDSAAWMVGRRLHDFSTPQQSDELPPGVDPGAADGSLHHDWRLRNCAGEAFWAEVLMTSISLDHGHLFYVVVRDISARKRREDRTRHLAEHDFLTDLPNRVLLLDRLSLALAAARRKHTMLAILFIDLDRFKEVNDTLGHHVGDELLKEIARRLVKCVRGADTVSRQGGDEFLIILADIGGVDQAAHVAGSVLGAIHQPFQLGPHALRVSGSVGISIYPNDGDGIEQLIGNADVAMYHAKESGRNGFQFFNADMHAQIAERGRMEDGLRQALRKEQFELAFHAEIDIASGRPVGVEALLRWRHPELGLLRPERFMAAAEEAGLMVPIGNWVLQEACRSAQRWHAAGFGIVVAVNLSAAQFAQKNLLASVGDALRGAGLAPSSLALELTEATIMKGGAAAYQILRALHELGVRLTIDDFGTGYSRLAYLKDYPVGKLKIDQSFVSTLDGNTGVISAIIGMARNLDMLAIAEGVETQEQLDFLRGKGCDQYQGYLADAQVQAGPLGKLLS